MSARLLIDAWLALVLLSVVTAAISMLTVSDEDRWMTAAVVLGLAGYKARLILGSYLGLRQSRFWTRLFDSVIVLFLAVAFALYLLGTRG
jgi:uncharacterized membrane protein YjjP (DUF1212 family)